MTPELRKITEEASHLRTVDPLSYETLTDAIKNYLQFVTVAVTDAPSADVLQAQGRAQGVRAIYRALTEVPKRP